MLRKAATIAVLSSLAGGLAILPAAAQNTPGGGGGIAGSGFSPPVQGVAPKRNPTEQAPPGLPGARPNQAAAPPSQIPLDVPPTEALFDAINRGDIASARDALNRGADIYGHNVLGMTPLDLSIDLSRNDITFLLMSMRSQVAGSEPARTGPPVPPGGKSRTSQKALQAKAAPETGRSVPRRPPVDTASSAPDVHYASIPATPAPQAGFLGFGVAATP